MIQIIIASVLFIFLIGVTLFAHFKTPTNLQGYYGSKYVIAIVIDILSLIALIVSGIYPLNKVIKFIIAIILILASIGSLIYSIIKTPERLRGYYSSKCYIPLLVICVVTSFLLIVL